MSRVGRWRREGVSEPVRPVGDPTAWVETYHEHGVPVPWLRVHVDGVDVTARPVSEWSRYDRIAYARGWRPDRFADPADSIPDNEKWPAELSFVAQPDGP